MNIYILIYINVYIHFIRAWGLVCCLVLLRYDEVEEEEENVGNAPAAKQSRITSFFQAKPKAGAQIDRPKFFVKNRIELVTRAARL